jgi:hypothetical protein
VTVEELFAILDVGRRELEPRTGRIRKQNHGHMKMFIPIGTEGLLDYSRHLCLFRVDGEYRKWVGEAEDIEFGQAMGSND